MVVGISGLRAGGAWAFAPGGFRGGRDRGVGGVQAMAAELGAGSRMGCVGGSRGERVCFVRGAVPGGDERAGRIGGGGDVGILEQRVSAVGAATDDSAVAHSGT